jgi:transcriptional regulator with XRE-family HTH domain
MPPSPLASGHLPPVKPAVDVGVDFPSALKHWRVKRGYSQLQLASDGGISQRHLSCLENGRSAPSRDMVLRLARTLDIPLRHRNGLLLAAGFAPAYRDRSLSDPELAAVKQALDFTLARHEPYPALVVDRLWNLLMANQATLRLVAWLLGVTEQQARMASHDANLMKLMFDPSALRQYLVNFEAIAPGLAEWIRREAVHDGPGSDAKQLYEQLLGWAADTTADGTVEGSRLPFLPVTIQKYDVTLNFFTTIATMGTPHDVCVHELRIETFFPADEETRKWLEGAC